MTVRWSLLVLSGVVFVSAAVFFWSLGDNVDDQDLVEQPSPVDEEPQTDSVIFRATPAPTRTGRSASSGPVAAAPGASHDHVVRQWTGGFDHDIETLGHAFLQNGMNQFSVPTFDGQSVRVRITRFEEGSGAVLRGEVAGEPGSLVALASVDGVQAGSIHIPSRGLVYEIRPGPAGQVIFSEVDVAALGECGVCLPSRQMQPVPAPTPP